MNLEESIEKGCNYLISQQNEDGSICLDNDRTWDVWETANSYLALHNVLDEKSDCLINAMDFLYGSINLDGSYSHSSLFTEKEYCMETTPICLLCLYYAKKNYQKTLDFILKNQSINGSWNIGISGIVKYKNFPSVTGYNLLTLLKMKINSKHILNGIKWILENQQDDGSWGSHFIYYDTPFYPLHVIIPVMFLSKNHKSKNYFKAMNFVLEKQHDEGYWNINTKYSYKPSIELRTALALSSIIHESDIYSSQILKGIQWIVKKQCADGHWSGGYFVGWGPDSKIHSIGKKEDILATAITIRILKEFISE